jgi:hypothetical protein
MLEPRVRAESEKGYFLLDFLVVFFDDFLVVFLPPFFIAMALVTSFLSREFSGFGKTSQRFFAFARFFSAHRARAARAIARRAKRDRAPGRL